MNIKSRLYKIKKLQQEAEKLKEFKPLDKSNWTLEDNENSKLKWIIAD